MAHVITQSLVPGDLVFDIGANLGLKAEWFAQRGMSVVCVEPQPDMVKALNERFARNRSVSIVPKGVGARRGKARMSVSSTNPTLSTFAEHWKEGRFAGNTWDSEVEVDVVLLDDLVAEFGVPRYCKIDVEGYELEVIGGLSRRVGIVSFEFTREFIENALLVVEKLIALGYRRYNLSIAEQDSLYFPQWVPYYELAATLSASRNTPDLWGDIYAN